MQTKTKHTIFAVISIALVSGLVFLYINGLMNAPAEPYIPDVAYRTSDDVVEAQYYITVVDETVFTSDTMTLDEAREHCESFAYSGDNMWKQVVCNYNGEAFYDDVFIAG